MITFFKSHVEYYGLIVLSPLIPLGFQKSATKLPAMACLFCNMITVKLNACRYLD